MKWILYLFVLGSTFNAYASFFSISSQDLGTPFYRKNSRLIYFTTVPDSGTFSVKFLDKYGVALEDKWLVKIKRTDYTGCSQGLCSATVLELPLALERYTCSLEIKLSSNVGDEVFSSKISWGSCQSVPPVPDRKYLSDFRFGEDVFFDIESMIEITNSGYSVFDKSLQVWGYLLDKEDQIIWRGTYQNSISLEADGVMKIDFNKPLELWQQKLGCKGIFHIDPGFDIFEKTKKNNRIELASGECEDVPSETAGDTIDLIPVVGFVNDVAEVHVRNDGRLPLLNESSSIEVNVKYLDILSHIIISKNIFTAPPLYGFASMKNIINGPVPTGTCLIEVEVNPNITIKESNYQNNRIQINICE